MSDSSNQLCFLYIANANKDAANALAKHLLEKRLIGCANIYPISSMYWWKGKIEQSEEYILIAKTPKSLVAQARAEVEKVHPYETPCILRIDTDPNQAYMDWIETETEHRDII